MQHRYPSLIHYSPCFSKMTTSQLVRSLPPDRPEYSLRQNNEAPNAKSVGGSQRKGNSASDGPKVPAAGGINDEDPEQLKQIKIQLKTKRGRGVNFLKKEDEFFHEVLPVFPSSSPVLLDNEQEYTHFEEVDAPFRPAIAEILPTAPCMQKKQKSPEECPVESGEKLNKEKMIKEENKIDQTRKDLYKTAVEEDDEKADDPKKPTSDKKDESSKNTSSDKTADKEVLPGMVESQTFLNPHEKNLAGKENKTKATALRPAAKSTSRRKLAVLGKLSRLSDRARKEPPKVGAVESQSNLNVGEKKGDDGLGKSPNITESESKTKVSEGAEASKPALVAPTRRKSLIGGFGKFSYASDKKKESDKNETCEKKGDDDLGKSPNPIVSESKTKVSEGAEASKPAMATPTRRKSLIGGFGKFSGIAKSDAAKPSAADSASKVSTDTTKSSGGTQEAALKTSAIGEKSTKVSNSEKKKKTKSWAGEVSRSFNSGQPRKPESHKELTAPSVKSSLKSEDARNLTIDFTKHLQEVNIHYSLRKFSMKTRTDLPHIFF
ncbi:hypothetical protein Q1695_010946 [Nippostrongylus brasiliensis]|nr:hypothetical protein Q1695_010946 [Nippostrongylus brasiliensis]